MRTSGLIVANYEGSDKLEVTSPLGNLNLTSAVLSLSRTRGMDRVTTVDVTVTDPTKELILSPALNTAARMLYLDAHYRLVAARKTGRQVRLTFEAEVVWLWKQNVGYFSVEPETMTRGEFVEDRLISEHPGIEGIVYRGGDKTLVQIGRGDESDEDTDEDDDEDDEDGEEDEGGDDEDDES